LNDILAAILYLAIIADYAEYRIALAFAIAQITIEYAIVHFE
jgi:hypothetical protein